MPPFGSQRGSSLLSTIVAASLIAMAMFGVGSSAIHLNRAMRKSELSNMAVVLEASLVREFNNSANFPAPNVTAGSPNTALRAGTLPALSIGGMTAGFGPGAINVPVQTTGTNPGAVAYLRRDLTPCGGTAFSDACVIRYEVRLRRTQISPTLFNYAFSYQIDVNPDVISMAPLGRVTDFNFQLDPGLYRAEQDLTKCDPSQHIFMTGMNRDTGEAFCVVKPPLAKCPVGKVPKGLKYLNPASADPRNAGILELDCTTGSMRTFSCRDNYALWKFDPRYADPESSYDSVPGKCVFKTAHSATLPGGSYPSNPSSPYLITVSGTFCPPNYRILNPSSACQLEPNYVKNSSAGFGQGQCASTGKKDCKRSTYYDSTGTNPAHTAWLACKALPTPPAAGCGTEPAPTVTSRYYANQISAECNGVVTTAAYSNIAGDWDSGTPYAYGIYSTSPTASAVATMTGDRSMSCTFVDTSSACGAPSQLKDGTYWSPKTPKWYGGVKVSGLTCIFQPSAGNPEIENAF